MWCRQSFFQKRQAPKSLQNQGMIDSSGCFHYNLLIVESAETTAVSAGEMNENGPDFFCSGRQEQKDEMPFLQSGQYESN